MSTYINYHNRTITFKIKWKITVKYVEIILKICFRYYMHSNVFSRYVFVAPLRVSITYNIYNNMSDQYDKRRYISSSSNNQFEEFFDGKYGSKVVVQ